jgi:hypothetical protein
MFATSTKTATFLLTNGLLDWLAFDTVVGL